MLNLHYSSQYSRCQKYGNSSYCTRYDYNDLLKLPMETIFEISSDDTYSNKITEILMGIWNFRIENTLELNRIRHCIIYRDRYKLQIETTSQ